MPTLTRSLTMILLCWSLFVAPMTSAGHSGLPIPKATLLADEVQVSFVVPEAFPVPVVEVSLNGSGPWRLAVDTAMGGTVMLRKELAGEMGLPVVGQAMVGDSSGKNLKPADLVQIDSMRLGQLEVTQIIGIGFAAGEAHLKEVPEDIHGILGNRIYAELLMTLDYPARKIIFRSGELAATDASVIEFEDQGNVMVVEMDLAGHTVPLIVDSGSRGTITLPESLAGELPLRGELREIESISTVSNTYRRTAARLDGQALLAGTRLLDPEIGFADEHTPKLIGYGVLKHFAITIDQAHGRLRWVLAGKDSLSGVTLER
jgi:hypothetical protein